MAREHKLPGGRTISLHPTADLQVYLAQVRLNELGARPRLAEDGLMGPATRDAFYRNGGSVESLARKKLEELERAAKNADREVSR